MGRFPEIRLLRCTQDEAHIQDIRQYCLFAKQGDRKGQNLSLCFFADREMEQIGRACEVIVERTDPLTHMYVGRTWMQAPDNVDGVIRFHPMKEHTAGEFVTVRVTKVSGQNLIGEEL